MAVTKYSYVKDSLLSKLRGEIEASLIVTSIDHLYSLGTALDVYFKGALSVGDKTILDQLVTDHSNSPIVSSDQPTDNDGSIIVRTKAAQKGRTYHQHHIQFITAEQNSLIEKDYLGNQIGHSTLSFFKYTRDMNGDKTGSIESCMQNMAEFSRLDFVPNYDYEIIGGEIRLSVTPNDDTYLWVIAAPDLPAPNGTKIMIENCNLKFYGPGDPVMADGKSTKNMTYVNSGIPDGWGNKLRFYVQHHQSINLEMQCSIELFKT